MKRRLQGIRRGGVKLFGEKGLTDWALETQVTVPEKSGDPQPQKKRG